jgi:hypothetical protein
MKFVPGQSHEDHPNAVDQLAADVDGPGPVHF